jgi:hypothetical protein
VQENKGLKYTISALESTLTQELGEGVLKKMGIRSELSARRGIGRS